MLVSRFANPMMVKTVGRARASGNTLASHTYRPRVRLQVYPLRTDAHRAAGMRAAQRRHEERVVGAGFDQNRAANLFGLLQSRAVGVRQRLADLPSANTPPDTSSLSLIITPRM